MEYQVYLEVPQKARRLSAQTRRSQLEEAPSGQQQGFRMELKKSHWSLLEDSCKLT